VAVLHRVHDLLKQHRRPVLLDPFSGDDIVKELPARTELQDKVDVAGLLLFLSRFYMRFRGFLSVLSAKMGVLGGFYIGKWWFWVFF
jgi:hypothetical protein